MPDLARYRAYREANRERLRTQKHEYYLANRDEKLSKARQYREVNREVLREKAREYRANSPERVRETELCRKYGLRRGQWLEIFEAQGRRCKVCLSETPRHKRGWHTDHCHETGVVRGILCHYCNVGVGVFKDDPDLLRRAARYLEESRVDVE